MDVAWVQSINNAIDSLALMFHSVEVLLNSGLWIVVFNCFERKLLKIVNQHGSFDLQNRPFDRFKFQMYKSSRLIVLLDLVN